MYICMYVYIYLFIYFAGFDFIIALSYITVTLLFWLIMQPYLSILILLSNLFTFSFSSIHKPPTVHLWTRLGNRALT